VGALAADSREQPRRPTRLISAPPSPTNFGRLQSRAQTCQKQSADTPCDRPYVFCSDSNPPGFAEHSAFLSSPARAVAASAQLNFLLACCAPASTPMGVATRAVGRLMGPLTTTRVEAMSERSFNDRGLGTGLAESAGRARALQAL